MESPIPSQEVIALGKKIAAELAKHDRTSPTIKWVSQYVAELIDRAEKAKDPAESEKASQACVDIILKLWRQKSALPYGARPLNSLRDALDVLDALKEDAPTTPYWQRGRDMETYTPFGKLVAKMRESHEVMFKIIVQLALADDTLQREKDWQQFPELLSAEEKKLIDELDWLVSQYSSPALNIIYKTIGEFDPPAAPKDRINLAFDKMVKMNQQQLAEIEALRAQMLKEKSSKKKNKI